MNGRETERHFGNGTSETTLYDRAGRVTVKAQNSACGELVWAEGYLYGEDGKRTATVDNAGHVTLYEYNKKGQLATVYYPYTQEMINLLKSEAEENGLPTLAELGENRFLPSDIKAGLTPLMNSMQYGLAYSLTNLQIFIKESYGYDKNGNRTSKTTNYGTIEYSYDKENRLLSSGSKSQAYVNYSYDSMGNLLTEESTLKTTKYAYNSQNRLIYCEVTDRSKKEYSQTNYAYDAFGRRIIVKDKGESTLRTLYDGLTFDVIKQSPTFENGLFTDSQNTGIRWSNNGKPTGERYRYIGDEERQDNNRYIYLDENTYKTAMSRYQGERTPLTVNGTLAAQTSVEVTQYFTTDLFGSVSTVSDSYGYKLDVYVYDAFGSLVQGELTGTTDFGYLGKQSDVTSKLYNYGYRDYKPEIARFTTVDPIRDGANWFVYCNNDPVDYTDPDGCMPQALAGGIIGGITGGVANAGVQFLSNLAHGQNVKEAFQNIDKKEVVKASISGAISGAITGGVSSISTIKSIVTTSKHASAVLNASANIIGTVTTDIVANKMEGKKITAGLGKDVAGAVIGGYISGAVTKEGIYVVNDGLTYYFSNKGLTTAGDPFINNLVKEFASGSVQEFFNQSDGVTDGKKIIKLFFVIIIISLPFLILLVINRFYPSFIRTVISDFENITHNREVAAVIAMILFYAVPVFILLKIYERFNK